MLGARFLLKLTHSNVTIFSSLQAIWDWVILFLVIYTAIFTPYVAAFLLNEPGYGERSSESYGSDPIVIIDLLGDNLNEISLVKIFLETSFIVLTIKSFHIYEMFLEFVNFLHCLNFDHPILSTVWPCFVKYYPESYSIPPNIYF